MEKKELSVFDYLSVVLPALDVIFILWIAFNSPQPWITTPIHLLMPILGLTALYFLRDKGAIGFYIIGLLTITPAYFLNFWGSETCPTWLPEFSFITGGLLLCKNWIQKISVLLYAFVSTIVPFYLIHSSYHFIVNCILAEAAVWFLLERSLFFMDIQQKKISEQKAIIEDKQKDIIDSIHYAKRIQQALLPSEKYIEKALGRFKNRGL